MFSILLLRPNQKGLLNFLFQEGLSLAKDIESIYIEMLFMLHLQITEIIF